MKFDFIDTDLIFRTALVFLRTGAILFALPVFGESIVPVKSRMFIALSLSLILTPMLSGAWLTPIDTNPLVLTSLVLKEIAIGFVVGLAARLAFDAILLGSNLVSYQMGFGAGNLMAPGSNMTMDSFTSFQRTVYILIFFSLNLHHVFIMGIIETFKVIPPGGFSLNPELATSMIQCSGAMFHSAIQIAAPITVALLFSTAALGFMARAVPALNVFSLSFAVNFMVGLLLYIGTMSFYSTWLKGNFEQQANSIFTSIHLLAPRGN
ncbi:MAG: flagellar biosynthetic protein FliR [Pseudomonadota bacterium]